MKDTSKKNYANGLGRMLRFETTYQKACKNTNPKYEKKACKNGLQAST